MSLTPGGIVRLTHDPSRVGTLTTNHRLVGGRTEWFVAFPGGFEWVPTDQLEPADHPKDPLDLLASGTLSSAADLRRVLTHARLGGRLQDVIYSLFTTKTDFYPHQFKPILRLLTGVSQSILIADEVGLGKTIEAGLIWTELRSRFEYQRLFVLCPAVLSKKWQMELRERFGIRADIASAEEAFERMRSSNNSNNPEGFALIGSMQGLRPPRDWQLAVAPSGGREKLAEFLDQQRDEAPLIDLLVIDEAHHLRNAGTSTSELGALLRGVASHVVLLSATPVNLHSDDLFSLMRLVDPDTFTNSYEFGEVLQANGPLVSARDRVLRGGICQAEFLALIEAARSHPVLAGSQTLEWLARNAPSDAQLADPRVRADIAHQLDQANLLGQVINRTRKRDVTEHRIVRNAVAQAVTLSEPEAEFYRRVTECVREFCKQNNAAVGFILTMPQRLMASSMPAAFRYWKERLAGTVSDDTSESEDEEDTQVTNGNDAPAPSEMGVLVRDLVSKVESLGSYDVLKQADSKYSRLREALRTYFENEPAAKVVLFTSFRATLRYLSERLKEDAIPSVVMHGDTDDKHAVIEGFRTHVGGMVLLSSEVGSEGVDLQFARLIVNYDLPWNPMRVEQRIGRLDRLGQRAKAIAIWNLYCADTIDQRIYERLYLRIGIFERALGGLEPILGEPIEKLTRELLMDTLTPAQEEQRIEDTRVAIENNRKSMDELEDNAAQFFALGDYLLERVKDARRFERHIVPEDLRNYVVEFLRVHYPASTVWSEPSDLLAVQIKLDPEAKVELEAFLRRQRIGRSTRLCSAGANPVKCRFENSVIETGEKGEELVSQFHPLVRYARERLTARESDLRLAIASRIEAEHCAEWAEPGRYMFVVERWAASGVQTIERLAYEVLPLGSSVPLSEECAEGLVHRAASMGTDWMTAAHDVSLVSARGAAEVGLARLGERYGTFERTLRLQNEDRANAQLVTLERQLRGQVERLREVNARLQAIGRTKVVSANVGRIQKLEERAEMRRVEIRNRSKITTHRTLFLMGLVEVFQ